MVKKILIPFEPTGNLIEFVTSWQKLEGNIIWKENYEFHAILYYDSYSPGNNPRFYFNDLSGNITYSMSMGQFDRVLRNCDMVKKEVEGDWTFIKHGLVYSIILTDRYVK